MPSEHSVSLSIVKSDSASFRTKSYATDDLWEHMRSTITQLYQTEGRPLREVMRVMGGQYNFHATERMFKTRVARWGLDKKLKEEEVMYMVRVKRERQAVGKDSIFRVRDQVVGWGRLEQYLRRRPDLENKRHMQSQGIPDLDIVCRTPSPPPDTRGLTKSVPPLPRRTLSIQIQEDAMRIFAGYHATAFACGVWVLEDENLCEHGFVYLLQAMSNFSGVPTSPEMNRSRDSLRALRRGLFSVRHILQTRDPRFYYSMLVAVLDVEDRFRESAIHFVYKIHDNVLGECHQLSCLWKKIFNLPQDLRLEAVRNMYAIISSHAEAEGASVSQYSLDVLRMRCSLLRIRRDVKGNEFRRIISGHATAADHCLGLARYGMFCKALFGLAIAQLDAGEIAEAAGTLSRIGSTVESTYDPSNQSQWIEAPAENRCAASSLCLQAGQADIGSSDARTMYGYYQGWWEPWSRWSPTVVDQVLEAYRQAGAYNPGAPRVWFNVLLSISTA